MSIPDLGGVHLSRMFAGNDKERVSECVCEEAPCGMVVPNHTCPQHSMKATKTIRRMHVAECCPAISGRAA
jgi:hypothetical protein